MGFVPAICSQCGGKIQVDTSREKNYCMHCGTLFVVEEVLQNKYDPIKETIDSALYRIKEMNDYDGAMNGLKSIESQASNKADYWWAVLDAKTHHFSHFEDEDDVKESFEMVNRVSKIGTISDEQYNLFYAYMVLCMKMAKQMSMYYVRMDHCRHIKFMALSGFSDFFEKRGDENNKRFFENYIGTFSKACYYIDFIYKFF